MSETTKKERRTGLRLGIASFAALGISVLLFLGMLNTSVTAAFVSGMIAILAALILGIAGILMDRKAPASETAIPMLGVFASVAVIIACVWMLNDLASLARMH